MKVPIAKPWLGEEEAQAAAAAVRSGWVTQGPKVEEFEKAFTDYTGAAHAVAVSNCTTALHLALVVAGVGPGDEVICPSMSYIATANSIVHAGATPVFAEVDEHFNLDLADAERRITSKTKAVLLVHQIGVPANISAFSSLCQQHKLELIEDAACAIGSAFGGKKIGAHSSLVCFSFHPRKVITTGDGGMITTTSAELAQRLRYLRQHGMSVNDRVRHQSQTVVLEEYLEVGYNYRMTDIQAAVGVEQMKRLPAILDERRRIASIYNKAFAGLDGVSCPTVPENCESNWQSYALTLEQPERRNHLMQLLLERGVATRRGIMTAHREPAYQHMSYSLPVSERLSDSSFLLPIYVPMTDAEVDFVVTEVQSALHA